MNCLVQEFCGITSALVIVHAWLHTRLPVLCDYCSLCRRQMMPAVLFPILTFSTQKWPTFSNSWCPWQLERRKILSKPRSKVSSDLKALFGCNRLHISCHNHDRSSTPANSIFRCHACHAYSQHSLLQYLHSVVHSVRNWVTLTSQFHAYAECCYDDNDWSTMNV